MSIRQSRKQERANQRDKWGYSMSLSRLQRRALRRSMFACTYQTRTGPQRLEIGASVIKDNIGASNHLIYGGGSLKPH